jgi:hypothetical protein
MPTYQKCGSVPKQRHLASLDPDRAVHAEEMIRSFPLARLAK